MAIQRHDEFSRHDARDGARLWEALRSLSDAQRQDAERALARVRGVDKDSETPEVDFGARIVVVVPGGGNNGTPKEWAPHEFARVLLSHLRELAHEQAQFETTGAEDDSKEGPPSSQGFSLNTENFPSLGAKADTEAPTKKAAVPTARTAKRRITTTLVSMDATFAAVAVNPPAAVVAPKSTSNTPASVWTKRDLLERRMGVANQIDEENASPVKSTIARRVSLLPTGDDPASPPLATVKPKPRCIDINPWKSPSPSIQASERKPPPLILGDKLKRSKRVVAESVDPGMEQSDETPIEVQTGANLQAAHLYGHLILQRFAPSICAELKFLVGLLYRGNCTDRTCATTRNEFCRRDASCAFALAAFEALEPLLINLGKDMLEVIVKTLDELKGNPKLTSRLRSFLHSREQQRVEESAKIGCEVPIETKLTTFRDYALPFCEDMDSRLNYRTPSESVIYSNREKIRDAFLSQLRSYQKQQNSLLGPQSGTNGPSTLTYDSQELLREVMPENHWWFARFLALELVQVGSNPLGESDKDLVMKIMEDKQVVKNPDRLRKLHRRFSSQSTGDSTANARRAGSSANGNKNKFSNSVSTEHRNASTQPRSEVPHKLRTQHSSNNHSPEHKNRPQDTKTNSSSEAYDRMRSYFSDNQAFFFHFLVSCDSYQFAELVKHQLESQFMSIWHTKSRADPRKEFTETVLRLKVLAKFIGFLKFSPQWHWSMLTSSVTSKNPALEAAQREAVATLEQAQSANAFDVLALLEESIRSKKIAKCIPWLCDFLMMSSSDALSSSTRYFQKVIELLAFIHRSELLERQGETGLYVVMQIERLFQLLGIDHLSPTILFRQQRYDIPTWVQPATYQALTMDKVPVTSKRHEDSCDMLPFLYSNMFVQVCISELEDLRGFIQTRARGSQHRTVAQNARRGVVERVPAIRKVRPLQVLRDDQLDGSSRLLADTISFPKGSVREINNAQMAANASDNPLRGAFFKLYPQVKRSVEFVVDVVVTNICEHAITKYVKPNADILIDSCVARAKANAPAFTQLILNEFQIRLDEQLEQFVATTVTTALEEAERLCESRVEEALKPLMAPSIPVQAVAAATKIAQAQAEAALASVLTRSLRAEFLKRIASRKRAIVKESGVPATGADIVSTPSPEMKDDPPNSVTRTLKFSFDETRDEEDCPLIESIESIKKHVVGMADDLERAAASPSNRSMLMSALRYHRAFRASLKEAVITIGIATVPTRRKHLSEIWSWVWRAVRIWLKTFALLASTDRFVDSPSLGALEAVEDFVSMLDVIKDLCEHSCVLAGGRSVAPLHRFVLASIQSIAARGNGADVSTQKQFVEACARVISHVKDNHPANDVPWSIKRMCEFSAKCTSTA